MRAPRKQRESFLYWLGREKIDFVRTWGRCSLSSSPSPWLYVYLDGINVTLCVCVTEKVRVSSQNEERSARKARKCERDGHKLREGNKPPLPPKLAQNNSLGFLHRLENNARKKWRARPSRDWSMSNRIAWKHRYHFSTPNDSFRVWVRVDFRPSRAGRDYQKQTGRKNIVVSHIPVKNKIQNPLVFTFLLLLLWCRERVRARWTTLSRTSGSLLFAFPIVKSKR